MKLRLLKTYMDEPVYVNVDEVSYMEIIAGYNPTPSNPRGQRIARLHFDGGRELDLGGNPEKIAHYLDTGEWLT